MNTDHNTIETLIASYMEGKIRPEDTERLREWVRASEDNRREYQRLRNLWEVTHPVFNPEKIDVEAALRKVEKRISINKIKHNLVRFFYHTAAVLLLPSLGAIFYLLQMKSEWHDIVSQEISTPFGTRSKVVLPDSSIVWLNSGSSLSYELSKWNDKRDVQLSGEAYFEVKTDPSHPFVVHTNSMNVCATGTAFNVEAYDGDSIVAVTMQEGKIGVAIEGNPHIALAPGFRMVYNKDKNNCRITEADTYKWIAWKDGKLVFRDDSLGYVFRRLEQTFNAEIILHDKELGRQVFRATFESESLIEIMDLLKMAAPIEYKIDHRRTLGDEYKPLRIDVFAKK